MTQTAQNNRLVSYDAAFAREIQALKFANTTSLVTALSGGPDSTALACLAERYARSHGVEHQAIIVNHNLRSNSAIEAERVCKRMQDRSITAEILTINDRAPTSGIQEWARFQRFSALTDWARQREAILLVAHHQADQAETVLMRLARGSGISGLAAIRPVMYRETVPVVRPLLNWSVAALRDVLNLLSCEYETDPSNQNCLFERVRVRNLIREGTACGYPTLAIAHRLGTAMAALSDHLNATSLPIWRKAASLGPTGHAVIDMNGLRDLPSPMWHHHVRHLIRHVGGHRYGVSSAALSRLRRRLTSDQNSTLGGCQFVRSNRLKKTAQYYVVREPGRNPSSLSVMAGDDVIFAGCWRVRTNLGGQLINAGMAPAQNVNLAALPLPDPIASQPFIVRRAIPVLHTLDGAVIYPQLKIGDCRAHSSKTDLSAQFLGL